MDDEPFFYPEPPRRRNPGWRITPELEKGRIRKAGMDCPTPVLEPEEVIKHAIDAHGDEATVSWSGGRCSTAVLYMAMQIKPDIRVNWNDHGVHFPETYEFVEKIREEWNPNLTVLKPEKGVTFWTCVEKYGFPMIRRSWKTAKNYESLYTTGRPMCCLLLKEKPLEKAGLKCTITGIRVAESRMRMFTIAQRGLWYYAKTYKRWNYHPIALWTTKKLLEYHEKHDIPQNKVYEMGQERCGCWPCTGYIGWRESLAESHPEMYHSLMRMRGEPTLWEFVEQGCLEEPEDA